MLKSIAFATIAVTSILTLSEPASAFVCASGVYRAGCVGPNGAVGVHRGYGYGYGYGGYHGGAVYRGGVYHGGVYHGGVYRRY